MKIKFNRYERIAGLFVLTAFASGVALTLAVAIKRGVFESKVELHTSLETADGLREGTMVSMQGLRIGQVTDIELFSASEVHVTFKVNREYLNKIRGDSVVRVMRPFIIGEKILDISVGSESQLQVKELAKIQSVPTADIMDLLSGRSLGPYVDLMGKMTENLKFVAEAFLDPKRSKSIVRMFDDLSPLLRNASSLTKEANTILIGINKDQQLIKVVGNLVAITNEVNRVLPTVAKESPEMLGNLQKIAKNMAVLTDELQKTLPMMQKLAPEIPRASERALEALDQTVITLKALQKSFILRGSVDEVRTEEALRRKQQDETTRAPAATSESKPESKPEPKNDLKPEAKQ